MHRCGWAVAALALGFLSITPVRASNFIFDLKGNDPVDGLRPGNQNPPVVGGTGGEVAPGISYDDVSNILTIHVAWGSGNGFTDLTGNAVAGHLHGPTSPPPGGYNDNAGVDVPLDSLVGWNPSASNGGFNGTVTLSALQETRLLASEYYMNVHTATNGNGEIRGQLVVVPEPSSAALLMLGASGLALRRRDSIARAHDNSCKFVSFAIAKCKQDRFSGACEAPRVRLHFDGCKGNERAVLRTRR